MSYTTTMHFKYAKMLAIFEHENMKHGDNSPEGLTLNHKIADKTLANCSPYFTTLQYINNLETKRSYKRTVNLKNLNVFLTNLSSGSNHDLKKTRF